MLHELEEEHTDNSLAPRSWDAYIGQKKVKERLQLAIDGAMSRLEPLKHVLLLGIAGTGKTSLAEIIAKELQADLLALTMTPNFKMHYLYKKIQDFEGGVIFLDELHCLSTKNQHYLLDVLEKRKMTYDSGKVEYLTAPITFIAATTEMDKIIKPMHARFPHVYTLEDYSDLEMAQIVERMALQLDLTPHKPSCIALGRASAGIPRQARRLVYAAQDLGGIDNVDAILTTCGVTKDGLTEDHVAYMNALLGLGCKAGIANIANHSMRPREVVQDLEKLLIKKGYVEITSSGRELTTDGLKALKEVLSNEEEQSKIKQEEEMLSQIKNKAYVPAPSGDENTHNEEKVTL